MIAAAIVLDRVASMLAYPAAGFYDNVVVCDAVLASIDAEAAAAVGRFRRDVSRLPLPRLQEMYADIFDFDPTCALDIGWHLFGDHHERGTFMAALRGDIERTGIGEQSELPDHLAVVLQLISRVGPRRAEQLRAAAASAIVCIRRGLEEYDTPYRHLLQAVDLLMEKTAVLVAG